MSCSSEFAFADRNSPGVPVACRLGSDVHVASVVSGPSSLTCQAIEVSAPSATLRDRKSPQPFWLHWCRADSPIMKGGQRGSATHVDCPRPREGACLEPPILAGPNRLRLVFLRFFSRLTAKERADVKAFVRMQQGQFDIGTFCSGTESPLLVWRAFAEACHEAIDERVAVRAVFAAESDKKKHIFIQKVWSPKRLFDDVLQLQHGNAYNVCTNSRESTSCLSVGFAVGGFPCKDASSLNNNSRSMASRTCIARGDMRTGSLFHGIVEFVRAQCMEDLQMLDLENVVGLAASAKGTCASNVDVEEGEEEDAATTSQSNLSCCEEVIRKRLGCWLHVWKLDPPLFGWPVSRPRLYLKVFPLRVLKAKEAMGDLVKHGAHLVLSDIMDRLVGSRTCDLESILLPESHPLITAKREQSRAAGLHKFGDEWGAKLAIEASGLPFRPVRANAAKTKWIQKHAAFFNAKFGPTCMPPPLLPTPEVLDVFPGAGELTDRELDLVRYSGLTLEPEGQCRSLELSQSIGRHKPLEVMDTITANSRKWLTSRSRLATGLEALRLQGMFFDDEALVGSFDDDLLMSLAGNAFECTSYAACMFAGIVLLACGCSGERFAPPLAPAPTGQDDESDACDSDGMSDLQQVWHGIRKRPAQAQVPFLDMKRPAAVWKRPISGQSSTT